LDENSESSSDDDDESAPVAVSKKAVDLSSEESGDDNEKSSDKASDSSSEMSADETSSMYVLKPICSMSYPQATEKDFVKRKASQVSPIPPKRIKLANGKKSSVDPAPDSDGVKSIFVGRLSWNVDNDWLAQEFTECGEVVSASVQMDRNTGKSRGFGYVHFATSDAVEAALALNGKEIDGRAVNVDKSHPPDNSRHENRSKAFGDETGPPSNTLFVANLAYTVKEDTLWELFGEYGHVKSVRLPTDRESGRPKGIGYVEFESVESAKKALHGSRNAEIEGRNVRLDFAQPRDGGSNVRGGRSERGGRVSVSSSTCQIYLRWHVTGQCPWWLPGIW
jgi:nucleolin